MTTKQRKSLEELIAKWQHKAAGYKKASLDQFNGPMSRERYSGEYIGFRLCAEDLTIWLQNQEIK